MIRKLLYRFRRLVLVWRLRWLERESKGVRSKVLWYGGKQYYWIRDLRLEEQLDAINIQIIKLDAAEMSKGEAHVIVR